MKFETKYLIRWGIPGWILIFWTFYQILFVKVINPFDSDLVDISKGFTLLISLTALGVPLGYLLHQIYFGIVWVWNKKRKLADDFSNELGDKFPKQDGWGSDKNQDYYQIEYVWHAMLINQDTETRAYLEGRYRHLLSTIHSMGSLFASSLISLGVSGLIAFSLHNNDAMYLYYVVGLVFQLAIFLSAMANYVYYSNNLKAFQIKMLKTYL
ncbi:hypothetical protein DT035_08605 [Bacillus subtilis]|uniref:hypothetical protein n=1 Tax=Bacillus subtilis TaxID=1423 RepID=UPI00145BA8A7|nr:hypothetical protein [Bacillus subtilis]MBA5714891.1 hypothetical protein [Bacillus subtilis]QNK37971.1 hypothetical protein H8S71_06400 [Bacillus subtilis subsp. subtilis]